MSELRVSSNRNIPEETASSTQQTHSYTSISIFLTSMTCLTYLFVQNLHPIVRIAQRTKNHALNHIQTHTHRPRREHGTHFDSLSTITNRTALVSCRQMYSFSPLNKNNNNNNRLHSLICPLFGRAGGRLLKSHKKTLLRKHDCKQKILGVLCGKQYYIPQLQIDAYEFIAQTSFTFNNRLFIQVQITWYLYILSEEGFQFE